uniref:Bifunctional lysine-specific demethylase and histidyl-hydroxylase n=1 Tax=Mucochytrium quahogii TaxID=96639 RepID=A0A7S2R987_9STRA|mmetsp:Transcript_9943/g.18821  ORF Transcript_9943/g.18821 Transcript_9943/m.18821 type:complete len:582 (-) Transcript_9943:606-2351(-)
MDAVKRKRQERNKRRAAKKRSRKMDAYSKVGGKVIGVVGTDGGAIGGDVAGAGKESAKVGKSKTVKRVDCKSKVKSKSMQKLASVFKIDDGDLARAGKEVLAWMIAPTSVETFFQDNYEDKPLYISRPDQRNYYEGLLSKKLIQQLVKDGKLKHNRDFSLTQYRNGSRKTLKHDTEQIATSSTVWPLFDGKEKCSVRLLRPHEHSTFLWKVVSSLEGFFKCGGGANAYLTPRGSQGFAPHYDDIDALIIQLEGKKHWTVYEHYKTPQSVLDKEQSEEGDKSEEGDDKEDDEEEEEESEDDEVEKARVAKDLFPRYPLKSSKDFTQEQVDEHLEIALKKTLEPGDFLYVPRGMVHQAKAAEDSDSLHITVSVNQLNSWANFIKEALPHAVEKVCNNDLAHDCADMRRTLPRDYTDFMGVINSDQEGDPRRVQFMSEMIRLISENVLQYIDFDIIADRMAIKFQHDRHAPIGVLKPRYQGADDDDEPVDLDTKFSLVAKGVATLTVEQDSALVYHSCKNTRTWHETDQRGLDFELDDAEAIETILFSEPGSVLVVKDLNHSGTDDDKLRIVDFLLSEGIVVRV